MCQWKIMPWNFEEENTFVNKRGSVCLLRKYTLEWKNIAFSSFAESLVEPVTMELVIFNVNGHDF